MLADQLSHKNCVCCTNKVKSQTVVKNFSVFPCITCPHFVSSSSSSHKTSIVTHKTSIFFFNPSSIFKKRYGFSINYNVFQVSSPSFSWILCLYWDMEIWSLNMELMMFWWVWYMGFVGFVGIMLILHVYMLGFVLCCAYHVHDKMSLRCFCVFLWTPLSTKIVGIIMFPWFWNINWLCVFTLYPRCTLLHMMNTHTHTLTYRVFNAMILSCFDILYIHLSFLFELLFKFNF